MLRSETIAKLAKAIAADENLLAAMQVVPRQTLTQIEGLTPDERADFAALDAGTLQALAGTAVVTGRTPISPFPSHDFPACAAAACRHVRTESGARRGDAGSAHEEAQCPVGW